MSEIEGTISRINSYDGVERILIIKSSDQDDSSNASFVRSMSKGDANDQGDKAQQFRVRIPQIGKEARSMIRQLDPKNDLTFLRIRSTNKEILIAPDKDFFLCVLQTLNKN
jgi:dynein light chain roadblock-type